MMSAEPITEQDICALTKVFYARVRKDQILGPVFNGKIGTDDAVWDKHIAHINDFWSSVFLKTGRFSGNPMSKHAALPGLTPEHFEHWLALFSEAAAQTLSPAKQAIFNETAARIARSLQMGLAFKYAADDIEPNPFLKFDATRPSRKSH